jgi:hypothetical protein
MLKKEARVHPIVPVAKATALKTFFREIENDERMSAVLKRASP